MNEVMKAILTRRSIRKFTDQPIPEDVMKDIVAAALHAPSGMGKQTWQFTVITNKEVIDRLIKTIGEARNTPDYNMYNPTDHFTDQHHRRSVEQRRQCLCP